MSASETFKTYLKQIGDALKAGNATEHTHRPAFKDLIESIERRITATNEPRRVQCGAPDFIITRGPVPLGYIETKDIGKDLSELKKSEQIKRYLDSLGNFILTDYLEFHWYVLGESRLSARLATRTGKSKLQLVENGPEEVLDLLQAFLNSTIPTVTSPKELAIRMAALARLIRNVLLRAFESEDLSDDMPDPLHDQLEGFKKVLLHDLTPDQFADMYAQTICYGLFAARCNSDPSTDFTRKNAGFDLPKTNRFLLNLFNYIAGPELDERIKWTVDDLAELLNRADIEAILADFGKRTRQEDPVIHFYETFLAHYDPKLKEMRGVYYTPEPIVSYIVRSVDQILKTDFGLSDGLADSSKFSFVDASGESQGEVHQVQILDPATGTGTFLCGVVDHIFESFKNNMGMWSSYVSEHLLPRLYGFELLMAPYAVAHMKLGIQLKETGYDFSSDERIGVFLTNTLEDTHEIAGQPIFTQWITDEASSASRVKKEAPVMVVLGNPPYSGHSANLGEWITHLLRGEDIQTDQRTHNYFQVDGNPLEERNPKWLNDDYVKFIRFAQWRIEQTGHGILAFVTNHGYLDNPTFRGMRQSLMETFDEIYLLDLHGSSKKKEFCPDGSKDENVFDIQQGVAIGIFVKHNTERINNGRIFHCNLWGLREIYDTKPNENRLIGGKYHFLNNSNLSNTHWEEIDPQSPLYLFIPQDKELYSEYMQAWSIKDIVPLNGVGMTTARDHTVIDYDEAPLISRAALFRDSKDSNESLCQQLGIPMKKGWDITKAREMLGKEKDLKIHIKPVMYRPFDGRKIFYHDSLVWRTVKRIMKHMIAGENLALITTRSIDISRGWEHIFVTKNMIQHHSVSLKEVNYLFPLYIYLEDEGMFPEFNHTNGTTRKPNLSNKFVTSLTKALNLTFTPHGPGDLLNTVGPEDIFNYIYAIFYSSTYRDRYGDFLKTDFPRLPLTSKPTLFQDLCNLGQDLIGLHLMEEKGPNVVTYPISGDSIVDKIYYTPPNNGENGRVWVNNTQYFDSVPPDVWDFHIGGYKISQRWLKDRKGRELSYDDLKEYQFIVAALSETLRIMSEIDEVIENHGGWPIR